MSTQTQDPAQAQQGRAPGGTPHPAATPRERDQEPSSPRLAEGDEPREGRELIGAAAQAAEGRDRLTREEVVDATEWFLSDEEADEDDDTYSFELNVGTPAHKKWVTWTIQSVDQDELRRIRRSSQQQNRRARITGNQQFDGDKANLQIVVRGTVAPDLRVLAKQKGLVDPADAVRIKFKKKPGLIDQIAGEIMSLSGYDEDDVREVDAARG